MSFPIRFSHRATGEVGGRANGRIQHHLRRFPRHLPAGHPAGESDQAITPRELEVLQCLANGLGTGEIADRMVISVSTARNHIQSILDKLGTHSRTEAVMAGIRQGLIKAPGSQP